MGIFMIENTKIYEIQRVSGGCFPEHYLALEELTPEEAYKENKKKTYKSQGWDFWGDSVYTFNYIDEEHKCGIVEWLTRNGVGKKRAKRIATTLIKSYQHIEDLEGVKFD